LIMDGVAQDVPVEFGVPSPQLITYDPQLLGD
jgi:hypothetical protein